MNILITNDDGYDAEGLVLLAEWAQKLGHNVTVVAPMREQSGKSHGIELHEPIEINEYTLRPSGIATYGVGSTPADCVRYADVGLGMAFDLVLSGINRGFNLGGDIMYSGTVGAVFEAAYRKIPAIAVSTDVGTLSDAVSYLDTIYSYFVDNELLMYGSIFNINIPHDPRGIVITKQGGRYYHDDFIPCGDGRFRQCGHLVHISSGDMTLDSDAVSAGFVSVTPLTVDRTDNDAFARLLKKMNL